MPHLQTERLTLVPFTLDLMNAAIESMEELGRRLGVTVAPEWPNADFFRAFPFFVELLEKDPSYANWFSLIVHTADSKLIGDMGFKSTGPDATGTVEIGYSIEPSYQGNGYATEMSRALIAWAFEQPGVTRVIAECLHDNHGSIRVLEKSGLTQLGRADDMLNWEIRKK